MPLRSVEAATRDDAISAAREQFGPSARVVGVRRVRSGGVLGFFATERYVAEVAPDPLGAPSVPPPAPARPAGALTEDPDTGSLAAFGSPLASAAPARARTAPPRNGAAAWAAEAARSGAASPGIPAPRSEPAFAGATASRAVDRVRPLPRPEDDARVDELADLLGPVAAPPRTAVDTSDDTPAGFPRPGVARASFPRATRPEPAPIDDDAGTDAPVAPATGAPSPFTAALARMVAGDRDVQHAVREALETSDAARSGREQTGQPASPLELEATNQPAVRARATHQEEETVGDQVIAPPSTSIDERTELPSWADELSYPGPPSALEPAASLPPVSREEAIAEVLRAALAEGHSDDALAGILRKVVAGDSPDTALDAPTPVPGSALAAPPLVDELPDAAAPEPPAAEPSAVEPSAVEPSAVEPSAVEPSAAEVTTDGLRTDEPVTHEQQHDLFAPAAGTVEAASDATSPDSALLWAEVVISRPAGTPEEPPLLADEPAAPNPLFDSPATATATAETTDAIGAEEDGAADPVEAQEAAEAADAEPAVADTSLDLEVAPVLARTASDPAPVTRSLSMDTTTVMPPLSFLPGSPGRGRGLPPVPPRTGRPPVPPTHSRAAGPTAPEGAPASADAGEGPASALDAPELLATVTRLPVAPLMPSPGTPEMPELGSLIAAADESGLFDDPELPAAVPARPARVPIDPPSTPAEVLSRLADLGVPADLLGSTFTTDVEADGIYAALTRALGQRLPEAPELPTGAGDVLFVVGPGVETLRAARSLAASLRLDPDRVQWATRGDLVGLAPETSRMSTIDTALRRRQDASASGTVTIVAVDAPLRTDAYWMAQMLAIWSPVAVWAVAEATRKPEDLEHWLDGLTRVDALIVQDTDLSADPAAVLHRVAVPVAVVDGVRATPHRWASVLCERLESAPA